MSDLPFKCPVYVCQSRLGWHLRDTSNRPVSLLEAANAINDLPLLLSIAEAAEKYRMATEDGGLGDYAEYYRRVDATQQALDTALSAWREGKGGFQ